MASIRSLLLTVAPLALITIGTFQAQADAIFNFENVSAGTTTPLPITVNGLTATFSGPAAVCNSAPLNLATLSGNVLIQAACSAPQLGPINIGFSSDLSNVSFNFATGGRPSATLTLQAFEGNTLVGTSTFNSSVNPPGNFPNGEGFASFSGMFNSLMLTTQFTLGIDNINAVTATSAVPEPTCLSMFAAGGAALLMLARRARKRSI